MLTLAISQQLDSIRLHNHWVTVNGIRLRAAVRDAANGQCEQPPLLILGGMGAALEILLPVADALPDRAVILLDLPGTGQSGMPHWPMDMHEYARFALAAVDRLGYAKIDILGFSWGGALAQQLVSQYGNRCRRLVLASSPAGVFSRGAKLGVMLKYLSPRRLIQPDYASHIAGDIYGGTQKTDSTLAIDYARSIRNGNRLGYYLQLTAMLQWHSPHARDTLTQPTLILAGSDDPLIPLSVAETLHQRIPGSRLKVFSDGHLFLLSQAKKAGTAINEFLTDDSL